MRLISEVGDEEEEEEENFVFVLKVLEVFCFLCKMVIS